MQRISQRQLLLGGEYHGMIRQRQRLGMFVLPQLFRRESQKFLCVFLHFSTIHTQPPPGLVVSFVGLKGSWNSAWSGC